MHDPICPNCGKKATEHVDCFPCPTKSVLDGVPVVDHVTMVRPKPDQPKPMSYTKGSLPSVTRNGRYLDVVGHCPCCGAPIYGKKSIIAGETPTVQHTCECVRSHQSFQDTIRTK